MKAKQQLIENINEEKNILIGVGLLESRIEFYKKELKRKIDLRNRLETYCHTKPKYLCDRIDELKLTIAILSE